MKTETLRKNYSLLNSPEDVKNIYENIPRGFSNFRKKCEKYLKVNSPISIPKPMNGENFLLSLKS